MKENEEKKAGETIFDSGYFNFTMSLLLTDLFDFIFMKISKKEIKIDIFFIILLRSTFVLKK